MMHLNKFVSCIKVGGKILREFREKVAVPFGSEYSILLKNLDPTRRALVNVYIDGKLQAASLVVNAASEVEIERSTTNNNLTQGNRFKFIERSDSVEAARGIGATDGLVEVEFSFEFVLAPQPIYWQTNAYGPAYAATDSPLRGVNYETTCAISSTYNGPVPANDVGITVPGSVSNQEFEYVNGFLTGSAEKIILHLVGELNSVKVAKPVTVTAKPTCVTCNRVNKATSKFCTNCGTGLVIIS